VQYEHRALLGYSRWSHRTPIINFKRAKLISLFSIQPIDSIILLQTTTWTDVKNSLLTRTLLVVLKFTPLRPSNSTKNSREWMVRIQPESTFLDAPGRLKTPAPGHCWLVPNWLRGIETWDLSAYLVRRFSLYLAMIIQLLRCSRGRFQRIEGVRWALLSDDTD